MVTANFYLETSLTYKKVHINLEFHTQQKYLLETKAKYRAQRIHHQQKCATRNAKESHSHRKKITPDGNVDPHQGVKNSKKW